MSICALELCLIGVACNFSLEVEVLEACRITNELEYHLSKFTNELEYHLSK